MRIVHVTDSYLPLLGGIETQVGRLAAHQVRSGHDVHVVTTTPAQRGQHGITTERSEGVVVHRIAARIPGNYPVHPRSSHYVMLALASLRPHVTHLHMGVLSPTVQTALPRIVCAGIPTVATVHSIWGQFAHGFSALDHIARWSSWPVAWSAVSHLTAAPLTRILPAGTTIDIIPNGLDVDAWHGIRTDRMHRADQAIHVVSAGRFAPRKRFVPLVQAIARASAGLPPHTLRATIAGTGPQVNAVERLASDPRLSGRVTIDLPGRLDPEQLRELYLNADVYVSPSIQESFGIAALEAQAAGLVLVSRSQSGVAERLTDGVDSLLADDDEGLSRALVRLAQSDGLLQTMLAHNAAHPPRQTWDYVCGLVDSAYQRARDLTTSSPEARRGPRGRRPWRQSR